MQIPQSITIKIPRGLLLFFLYAVIGFLLYGIVLKSDFIFDDTGYLLRNPAFYNLKNFRLIWEAFNCRFLTGLSFALNYFFGQFNPPGYHLVNICLHIFSAFFVFTIAKILVRRVDAGGKGQLFLHYPIFVGLLFLVHPVQTQAVSYISGRWTSMVVFWYLLTVLLYLQARIGAVKRGRYLCALATAVCAMFSKELAVTLPVMLICIEWIIIGHDTKSRPWESLRNIFPFLLCALLVPLALSFESSLSVFGRKNTIAMSGFQLSNVYAQLAVLGIYLRLFFFPVNQNIDYDYSHFTEAPPVLVGFYSILFIGLVVYAVKVRKRKPLLALGIAWFFVASSIEFFACALGFTELFIEYYVYLPSVGLSVAAIHCVYDFISDVRVRKGVLVGVIVVLSFLTAYRNYQWSNPERIIKDAVNKSPNKVRLLNVFAGLYLERGDFDSAEKYIKLTCDLDPDAFGCLVNTAFFADAAGKEDLALESFEKALRQAENQQEMKKCYFGMGKIYERKKEFDKAKKSYSLSIRGLMVHPDVYTNLANINLFEGNVDKALSLYKNALLVNPYHINARNGIAGIHLLRGEYFQAIKEYKHLVRLFPYSVVAYKNLGVVYLKVQEPQKAEYYLMKAREINPYDATTYQNLADVYITTGDLDSAEINIKKARYLFKIQDQEERVAELEQQYAFLLKVRDED